MMQKKQFWVKNKVIFNRYKHTFYVSACMTLIPVLFFIHVHDDNPVRAYLPNPNDNRNTLVYLQSNYGANASKTLLAYDLRTGVSTSLVASAKFDTFSLSSDSHLAYSALDESDTEVYVLDTLSTDSPRVNISQNPNATDIPLAWSPDGRYLAFESYQDEQHKHLEVWDGTTVTDISPEVVEVYQADRYDVAWSADNRLAFMLSNIGIKDSEIYLWDGKTTQILSQNPNGEDGSPVWSADGRLAFLSERDGTHDILIWDGVSVKNGRPDKETFIQAAPGLTTYDSFPTWTNSGQLAFSATDPRYSAFSQVFVWDGQTATNISQNAGLHNGSATWSIDGRWAFTTFFSPEQLVYVRSVDNRTIFTAEGEYSPAWSLGGYLMFCRYDRPDWVLSVWDGKEAREIVRGGEIFAQWQGGANVVCSSG